MVCRPAGIGVDAWVLVTTRHLEEPSTWMWKCIFPVSGGPICTPLTENRKRTGEITDAPSLGLTMERDDEVDDLAHAATARESATREMTPLGTPDLIWLPNPLCLDCITKLRLDALGRTDRSPPRPGPPLRPNSFRREADRTNLR